MELACLFLHFLVTQSDDTVALKAANLKNVFIIFDFGVFRTELEDKMFIPNWHDVQWLPLLYYITMAVMTNCP